MRQIIVGLVLVGLFLMVGCQEEAKTDSIRVIEASPNGDVKINAGESVTKPRGMWPFIEVMNYDIFDDTSVCVARITITQTFPTYSIGTITTRLDGSGTRPNPKNVTKGMVCQKTTTETLRAEKRIYRNQKKAFKRQYKLMKLRAKSGVFTSLEKTVEDANEIKAINYHEEGEELFQVEKK